MSLVIIFFFIGHWYLSAFCQSFFLHRYSSHSMFTMSPFWERFFHLATLITQGSSFLNPKAYAILHRQHHIHSDTEKDPHSPHFFKEVFSMMWNTYKVYEGIRNGTQKVPEQLSRNCPEWPLVDKIGASVASRLIFCVLYVSVYVVFAPSLWWYLLLPIHFLIGPIHGAFVNWCGHKYGYRNFKLKDHSHNTFNLDFLVMGECFQNNHHKYPQRPNFAIRWFEIDITYPFIVLFNKIGIISLNR